MVRFWDKWCGELALQDSFPSLFELVVNKEVKVAEVWDFTGVEGEWSSFC